VTSPQLVVLRALLHDLIAVVQLPLDGSFELSQDPSPEMPHLQENKSDPGNLTHPLESTLGSNSKRGGARSGYPAFRLDSCLCRISWMQICEILGSQALRSTGSVSRAVRQFSRQSSPLNLQIKTTSRCKAALPKFSRRRHGCNFSNSGWSWKLGLQVRNRSSFTFRA
jgi:hypothetical protein